MGKRKKRRKEGRGHPSTEKPQSREEAFGSFTMADLWPKSALPTATKPAEHKKESHFKQSIPQPPPDAPEPVGRRKADSGIDQILRGLPQQSQGDDAQTRTGVRERRPDSEPMNGKYREQVERITSQNIATSDTVNLILGLDLGTSFTKCVWRDEIANEAYPICFGQDEHRLNHYLLPSVVAFDGELFAGGPDVEVLVRDHPTAERFSNFKMCLACVSSVSSACNLTRCPLSMWRPILARQITEEDAVEVVTALHLGKVISVSKALVSEQMRNAGVRSKFHWTVNMGAPVEHMEDAKVLDAFRRVLKTGFLMSSVFDEQEGPRDLEDLLELYGDASQLASRRTLDCFVIPEVGAEVASLYKSGEATDGLYSLIDVGAGTLDATFFRLFFGSNGTELTFYAAGVLKAGAAHLESVASRQLAERATTHFREVKEGSRQPDTSVVSAKDTSLFLERASDWLREEVEVGVRKISAAARKKEHNHDAWRGLTLLLGGGGSAIPLYESGSRAGVSLLAPEAASALLPVPHDFKMQGLPPAVFHRFAVAYGLSFNIVDQEFSLPSKTSDDKPQPVRGLPENPTPDVG